MTEKQQDTLINIGIQFGIVLAGIGLAKANQYLRENNPEAASITRTLKDIVEGARMILDPYAIDIEELKKKR